MVIDPNIASEFIKGYKEFLLYARRAEGKDEEGNLLNQLDYGRNAYLMEKDLLERFRADNRQIPDWVLDAIQQLEVADWVYLRDTTKYSLFMKADEGAAYAVQGLTEPIREFFGHSGIYLRTGIFPLGEHFVCDGLIIKVAHLGKNYREAFNERYRELKSEGRFFKAPIA
jgi:hypothetical protein